MLKRNILLTLVIPILIFTGCAREDVDPIAVSTPEIETSNGFTFTSDRTGKLDIYQSVDGMVTPLSTSDSTDVWWSRKNMSTGKFICYQSTKGGGFNNYSSSELWLFDEDQRWEKLIDRAELGWKQQGFATWRHDGKSIVMSAIPEGEAHWQLYSFDIDLRSLENISPRSEVDFYEPTAHPFSDKIAYAAIPEGKDASDLNNLEIFELDLISGVETQLTNDDFRDQTPSYSRDGKKLVYSSLVDPDYLFVGKWSLKTVDCSTGSVEEILNDAYINLMPRFAINSQDIIYTRLDVTDFTMGLAKYHSAQGSSTVLSTGEGNNFMADPF